MSTYYCLIAGLPELHFDDAKLPFTVASFKEESYPDLSEKDKEIFDRFFYQYDNQNLLALLKDKEAELNPIATLSPSQLEEQIRALKEEDPTVPAVLPYLRPFLSAYLSEKPLTEGMLWEDQLSSLYYDYALQRAKGFEAAWYTLNLNINNLLVALIGRKHNTDTTSAIIGDNEIAVALRTNRSRDFGLTGVLPYLETLQRIAEEENPYEREQKIDRFKWQWIEEETFFAYFTQEKLFGYLLQISLLERWHKANAEAGEEEFRRLLSRLKAEVQLPKEFAK